MTEAFFLKTVKEMQTNPFYCFFGLCRAEAASQYLTAPPKQKGNKFLSKKDHCAATAHGAADIATAFRRSLDPIDCRRSFRRRQKKGPELPRR